MSIKDQGLTCEHNKEATRPSIKALEIWGLYNVNVWYNRCLITKLNIYFLTLSGSFHINRILLQGYNFIILLDFIYQGNFKYIFLFLSDYIKAILYMRITLCINFDGAKCCFTFNLVYQRFGKTKRN